MFSLFAGEIIALSLRRGKRLFAPQFESRVQPSGW